MYVVTVDFILEPQHAASFRREVLLNAATSLEVEPGCRVFDVCAAPDDPSIIFLYEVYADRAAFDAHLQTAHFRAFDAEVAGWVLRKSVRTFERI